MARPKKAVVDYFPHYVTHGKTMFAIEGKFGNDGYAFWFKLLEMLGSSENHYIDCNDFATWEFLLAKTRLSGETADNILAMLANCGSIDAELWQNRIIWSEHFVENLSTVYIRRRVSAYTKEDVRGLCIHKPHSTTQCVVKNPQSKVKESKVKEPPLAPPLESDDKNPSKPDRKKPAKKCPEDFTVTDDMQRWFDSKGYSFNIETETEKFLNFHGARGSVFSDWVKAWRGWMMNVEDFSRNKKQPDRKVGELVL